MHWKKNKQNKYVVEEKRKKYKRGLKNIKKNLKKKRERNQKKWPKANQPDLKQKKVAETEKGKQVREIYIVVVKKKAQDKSGSI